MDREVTSGERRGLVPPATRRRFGVVLLAFACGTFALEDIRAAELPTYTIVAKGGRLSPEMLEVPGGVKFKIVIRNEGPGPIEFESSDLKKEKVLSPGAQSFVVVAPLRPGEYRYFDEFHPETGRGRIVVK